MVITQYSKVKDLKRAISKIEYRIKRLQSMGNGNSVILEKALLAKLKNKGNA